MDIELTQIEKILYKINKPSHYMGDELRSCIKEFNSAKATMVLAFPDKYEVGVSNLGHRVLYQRINSFPDFYADRVYAPDNDLRAVLEVENVPLWSVEKKKSLKSFDYIGFSLQYELAYPTVLKMLDIAGIEVYSSKRNEDEPIILAGGPCAYNPLPISDFIDAFLIGDGEDLIIEVMDLMAEAKAAKLNRRQIIENLSKLDGIYVPAHPQKVKKRICNLEFDKTPVSFPIPYSKPIHDRVVTEIRRGCGRMCRFCQPGHVNLPIRERSAKDVIDLTLKAVENTGYDEYSLLSLSSNDYTNIIPVVQELNCKFAGKNVSVSLPSQRIDSFNMDLTNLVQSVRKSTITLAPEAGSQRLRDVINKNISQEQILHAILELYKNGFSKVKLYFILGLPSETYEDLDELLELLALIVEKANALKRELGLKTVLTMTVSMSIFIPKPFTPLQWCAQDDLETIGEKIHYIKAKPIKGVKINIHDKFISQLEAVLTRADSSLCQYIYNLYKKGAYLDTWDENFSYYQWREVAEQTGVDLAQLACKTYGLEEDLPWDFINIGVEKNWLQNQYKLALKSVAIPTCETNCVACGVCSNLSAKKIIDKPYIAQCGAAASETAQESAKVGAAAPDTETKNRFRLVITKEGGLRFISHLDFQSSLIRIIQRAGLEVAYSQGFNPSPKISLGVALPIFIESETEILDIEFIKDYDVEFVRNTLEKEFSGLIKIKSISKQVQKYIPADILCQWACYEVSFLHPLSKIDDLLYIRDKINSSDNIFIEKKNKKGIKKQIDIKNSIQSVKIENDRLYLVLKSGLAAEGVAGDLSQAAAIPSLRADVLLENILPNKVFRVRRKVFYDKDLNEI